MVYFDNAATTMLKPPEVARAVSQAIDSFGGGGRSAYGAALIADKTVHRAREQISALFDGPGAAQVAFGLNATDALNTVVSGLLHSGDHAITTAASHNSVLRPLFRKQDEGGVSLSILPVAPDGSIDYEEYTRLFRPKTRLVVVTHASNLTGDIYDIKRMARIAHEHDALIAVDCAQTAGVFEIDMQDEGLDVVVFTGHKSLFGPQGTGGLCVSRDVRIPALKEGGSGTHSYDRRQPDFMPTRLEAGTLNSHGIAGLSAGLGCIQRVGIGSIASTIAELTNRFEEGALSIPGVRVYGGHAGIARCGIVALNVRDEDSAAISDALSVDYGICTRAGTHCSPLMHAALGTTHQGAVRFSFSLYNTHDEIDEGLRALGEIAARR